MLMSSDRPERGDKNFRVILKGAGLQLGNVHLCLEYEPDLVNIHMYMKSRNMLQEMVVS